MVWDFILDIQKAESRSKFDRFTLITSALQLIFFFLLVSVCTYFCQHVWYYLIWPFGERKMLSSVQSILYWKKKIRRTSRHLCIIFLLSDLHICYVLSAEPVIIPVKIALNKHCSEMFFHTHTHFTHSGQNLQIHVNSRARKHKYWVRLLYFKGLGRRQLLYTEGLFECESLSTSA